MRHTLDEFCYGSGIHDPQSAQQECRLKVSNTEYAPFQIAVIQSAAVIRHLGIRYLLAADYWLSKERGTVTLACVQAWLHQCFWLLTITSQSMLGFNRNGSSPRINYIDQESPSDADDIYLRSNLLTPAVACGYS